MKNKLKILLLFLLLPNILQSQQIKDTLKAEDILQFSFDDLLNVKVISASNSLISITEAPSVMTVITADDLSKQG